MQGRTRSLFILLTVGVCCTGLFADATKDAWKNCKKAGRNETETKLRECSIAIESGALSNRDSSEAYYLRASAYIGKADYDRAIKDLDESVRLTPSSSIAFDFRGWAYLGKFEFKRAIQDFDQAIQLDSKNSFAYANRGIAEFLLGDYGKAENDFVQNEKLSPKPARGYSDLERLLAHLRDAKGKMPGTDLKLGAPDLTQWPGPIIGFYGGFGTEDTVLSAADSTFPAEKKWKLCQAYFFLAEHALLHGDREKAMQLLQKSLDTGATADAEYMWARGELHNLQDIDNKDSARPELEGNRNSQDTTAKPAVELPANPTVASVPSPKASDHPMPDLSAIHPGSSTREQIRVDWACCGANVVSDRLFIATPPSERGKIKYLLVEFDERGVVSRSHLVSPDDMVPEAVSWARRTAEPLDLSSLIQLKPAIVAFAGWRVHYFSGPIQLQRDGLRIGGEGSSLMLKPDQLSRFRQCGALKISLHHTCTGFGAFGVDVDEQHPGTQIDVSGLPDIGSHLHILMNVPDLFTFVRYLRQTAPLALANKDEN
jgi:lipoprotein NlpI